MDIKNAKAVKYASRFSARYNECNITMVSKGLVYATLMAIIPVGAIIWFMCDRLGILSHLVVTLSEFFMNTFGPDTGNMLIGYIERFTQNALGLGITGIASFLVTFVLLIDKVWNSINRIFETEKGVNPIKRYASYLAILIVGVIAIALWISIKSRFSSWFVALGGLPELSLIQKAFRFLMPIAMTWGLSFCLYYFVPHCKVKFGGATLGSILCTVGITVLSRIFVLIVNRSVKYSIIYGSLAAILFFLMFLAYAWQIVLTCAVVAHLYKED